MTIEKLTKLHGPKRILPAVVAVLVVAGICYFAIARHSVVKLQTAKVRHSRVQALCDGAEDQRVDLLNLQKQLADSKKQLKEHQEQCFSSEDAARFFENINAIALAYNLKPISRIISEPKKLVANEIGDEEVKPPEHFLQKQSAKVAVSGNYLNIIDFANELTDRPQQVCITNLHIGLPAGENFNPKASFKLTLFIDSSKGQKQ